MAVELIIDKSINPGIYCRGRYITFGLFAHNLQCDRRWIFLIRFNWKVTKNKWSGIRFGYLTRGDATPDLMSYQDAGWFWPWKWRSISGRG